MKNTQDKFKLRYIYFSIAGYTLFVLLFIIQFFIFTPLSIFFYIIGVDKKRKFFTYATKFSCLSFFTLFIGHKVDINKKDIRAPKKGEKRMYLLNHSTIYDVILSYLLPGPSKFIIKDKWVKKPFIGWMQAIAGNIVVGEEKAENEVTETPPAAINATVEAFDKGIPIIIFPEGTRSTNGQIQRFKRGSFRIALDGHVDIVPVVLDDWNCIRTPGLWIRDLRPAIRIMPPIKYEEYKHLTHIELAKLVRYMMTKALYDLRTERKQREKHYYRKADPFMQEDEKVKEELDRLTEELAKKGIALRKQQ